MWDKPCFFALSHCCLRWDTWFSSIRYVRKTQSNFFEKRKKCFMRKTQNTTIHTYFVSIWVGYVHWYCAVLANNRHGLCSTVSNLILVFMCVCLFVINYIGDHKKRKMKKIKIKLTWGSKLTIEKSFLTKCCFTSTAMTNHQNANTIQTLTAILQVIHKL